MGIWGWGALSKQRWLGWMRRRVSHRWFESRELEQWAGKHSRSWGTKRELQPKTGIPQCPGELLVLFTGRKGGGGDCPSVPNNLENFEGNLYFLPNFLWGFSHLSLLSVELSCRDILLKLRGVSVFMHWLTFHCCLSQQSWHSYLGNLPGNKLLLNSNGVEAKKEVWEPWLGLFTY